MTPDKQTRPAGNRTGQKAFRGAEAILPDAAPDGTDPRPRCAGCGHVLTAPRSLTRGMGPTCWSRVRAAQALDRLAAVRVRLDALAGRVAVLDARGLALVADRLADLEDALGGGPR